MWVVDYILRETVRETGIEYTLVNSNGRRHPAMKISELAFADDVALVTNTTTEAQILLHAVESYARKVGLYLNPKKTEIMICSGAPHLHAERNGQVRSLDGFLINVADDFKYLAD